jgi:oligopeptide transport system ATP-binding protein
MIGLILVLLMIFLAFVAPLFSGYAYDEIVMALNAKERKKAAVGISPRVPAIHEMVTGEPYDDIYADKTFLFGTDAGVVHAIRGINLDLQKGETVAIVGESGSGKSVTMKAAVGLLDSNATINSGEILYTYDDGHGQDKTVDLLKLSKKQLRTEYNGQRLAMVFQDPMASLNPRKKVGDIISEGMDIHHRFANRQEREEKISEMLKKVGLSPEHAARYPHQFSGGQRQRVGIARALIMNPKLIIADECISALDVSIQAQVVNLMKDIQEETQCAYLFIAHDLSMVKYISDRIGVLHLGYMVESGTKEEIFSHPVHPYTKSLLSAIPHPNPVVEKHRVALTYNYATSGIDYAKGTEHSVGGTHTVLATDEEFDAWTK